MLLTEQNLSVLSQVDCLNTFYPSENLHFSVSKQTFFPKVNSNMYLSLNLPPCIKKNLHKIYNI